eukprot:CAMPEP_0202900654 /NCGR_PEP_ID=MMETSP1392-20130828/11964_1 /ASSEMBLY_ACC=CAM_ASM_000868 /TAXON_ID=225041 /ORGANISM="Chlamydomonas chlamydogama, Strain SAG 11-48b" /LENGTH=634 /DNA_ID=CAMNT_0049587091 /DNA_START=142 /DNA_END=2046 /DNA_ORIENTATION=+
MSKSRIDVLTRQFTAGAGLADGDAAGASQSLDFCPKAMYKAIVHDNEELRNRILDFLSNDPIYKPNFYLSLMDFRELTLQRVKKFVGQKYFSVRDYLRDPRKFMAALECLSFCDYSMAIKSGVHFTLCGGTICKLGTQKHHDQYLPRLDTLDLTGSFSMTELGHGSNVMGIETTAVYDHARREFIINTPNDEASKFWIGGTGQHGKVTTVFAQLTVNGKWEGPHVFLVRIRDDNLNVMPNIRIKDNGPKMGLNGVDNGQVWFDNVHVPYDAMLDAYASIDESGTYRSPIPSVSQRFGTMVGGLTTGRVLIGQGGVDALKIGLTVAIRYACQRPQFGNKLIMSYLTHQARLLPALANTYALQFAMGHLKSVFERQRPQDAKLIHVLSSGLKAAATWSRVEGLQNARECCGGMGVLAANRIGPLLNDMNVDVTFEGDNTVMMQQVARALVEDKKLVAQPPAAPGNVSLTSGVTAEKLVRLLQYREQGLAYQIGSQMAAAAARAGSKVEAEKAAGAVFDSNLDLVVKLGWANVERFCLENFLQTIPQVDASLRPALQHLALLYGMTRVERDTAFFLASGVLGAPCLEALRGAIHRNYAVLSANNGKLALKLCDGFGIPEALMWAPIAKDWRAIGTSL